MPQSVDEKNGGGRADMYSHSRFITVVIFVGTERTKESIKVVAIKSDG